VDEAVPRGTAEAGPNEAFAARIGAAAIDHLLFVAAFVALAFATGGNRSSSHGFSLNLGTGGTLGWWALALAYYFVCEAATGQTLGKRLVGVRVVGRSGGRPGAGAVAVRTLLRAVDVLPLLYAVGLITALATGNARQRVGDMAAGTFVTRA
jgi:uncharacterized RDD family membrane protein YckC